ncbi:MAG: ABC transporter ATP-binding protein [Veillonella caviae]|uniref:ABC transporter ATP-binding protein n=2 Tax=Veillonella caviae TaxID=248316 RepID=UPI002A911AD9|nr:ABC transporter ATP-binding protein [Veillonella caviae]MCI5709394.1 ABC transporter ATP-binding protein [Veillonella caviae]MDY5715564.1 ABC transporter ATP-binding protein [Veillonella caviae]
MMNIETLNLHAGYDDKKVLSDISVTIPENRITGVIGPNGSGKSTLLKCIYRIIEPTEGVIMVNGRYIKDMSYKESAKEIAVLMQHHGESLEMTAEDIVLMARNPYKGIFERDYEEDYEIAHKAMDETGVYQFKNIFYSDLSGGEQQRVMLARTIAQETPCIILDEPTNHLDITYQLQIMNLISERQLTVVAAIHDLNIAALYCDELIAMKEGRIVVAGPTREVLTSELIYTLYGVDASVFEHNGHLVVAYERGGL